MAKPKKFIQAANLKKGALHKALGVPMGEKIPAAMLDKAMKSSDLHLKRMAVMAKNLGKLRK